MPPLANLIFIFILLFSIIATVDGLHESDVGFIDWHKRLVGVPAKGLGPVFQRIRNVSVEDGGNGTRSTSVLIMGTEMNVVAGLDPMEGGLLWRHALPASLPLLSITPGPSDLLVAVAGPGGAHLSVYTALRGELVCEKQLHAVREGRLEQPASLGTAVAFGEEESVYVLSNGRAVTRLSLRGCSSAWKWETAAESHSVIYTSLHATPSAIYVAGLTSSFRSYTLHLTAISPMDGATLADKELSFSVNGPEDFFFVGTDQASSLAWIENDKVHYLILDPSLTSVKKSTSITSDKGKYTSLTPLPSLSGTGHFLAHTSTGHTHILSLSSPSPSIKSIWEFLPENSKELWSATRDKEGNIYIARAWYSETIGMGTLGVYSSGEAEDGKGGKGEAKGMVTQVTFPWDTEGEMGAMQHVSIDISSGNPLIVRPRYVVRGSYGGVGLWYRNILRWTRDESLSTLVKQSVLFVDLPAPLSATSNIAWRNESIVGKVLRQVADLENLPAYTLRFVRRMISGVSDLPSASQSSSDKKKKTDFYPVLPFSTPSTTLVRDTFGFRKLIVGVAGTKVYALETGRGEIVWGRRLELVKGEAEGKVKAWRVVKSFVVRRAGEGGDGEEGVGVGKIVVERLNDDDTYTTLIYTFHLHTGLSLRGDPTFGPMRGEVVIEGKSGVRDAWLGEGRVIILVDGDSAVHLHPDNAQTRAAFSGVLGKMHIPLLSSTPQTELTGHRLLPSTSTPANLQQTWALSLPILYTFRPPSHQPIASFGKVLANRTTLYKYLNPNLLGVISAPCAVQIVDAVSGHIVYRRDIPVAPEGRCDVKAAISENWFVYHYWDPNLDERGMEIVDGARGWRIVSVEFYEGGADEKLKSSETSAHALAGIPVSVYESAFVFPGDVEVMGMTSTEYGITVKDLIVASKSGKIQTFPRRMLDPRRPRQKPTAKEIEEEWLVQYDPLIVDEPKRTISHKYDLLKLSHLHTHPTTLESTSLVFVAGLDLFFTRVSPSGTFDLLSEGFNKAQLMFTTMALLSAIAVTRPMVRRKRLREKWYY